jgi:integrase
MMHEQDTPGGAEPQAKGKRRRGHGEGTITPRGTDPRTGLERWLIRVPVGIGPDGNRQRKAVTFHGNRKAARAELNRLLAEAQGGTLAVGPAKLTVGQYLERWLAFTQPRVSRKTYEGYAMMVAERLRPALGTVALARLTPMAIDTFYADLLKSGRKDGKGGLSGRYAALIHKVLNMALSQAVRWQLLARNPCSAATPPRVGRREPAALDEEGSARLLQAARDTPLAMPILLAVTCGLRRAELCGLRWEDVDLPAGVLHVRQAAVELRKEVEIKEPKTDRSRRKVALPSLTVEALRRHREEQQLQKLALGSAWQDSGRVLTTPDGAPWRPDCLTHAFARLLRREGLGHVRLHDLRHSHCSQLLKAGVPLTAVSARLGHSSTAVTATIYAHLLPGMDQDAADRTDAALRKALGEAA